MKSTFALSFIFFVAAIFCRAAEASFVPGAPPGYTTDAAAKGLRQGQEMALRAEQMRLKRESEERVRLAFENELKVRAARAAATKAEQRSNAANPGTNLSAEFDKPDAKASDSLTERLKSSQVVIPEGSGIERLMSHAEFTNSGLTKLSQDEIKALNEWLHKRMVEVAKHSALTSPSAETASVIETQIDGDFEGWDGDTVWKMANGQIWQQAEYSYTYSYAFCPEVVIYRSSGGWKMKVEDESEVVAVKRIK